MSKNSKNNLESPKIAFFLVYSVPKPEFAWTPCSLVLWQLTNCCAALLLERRRRPLPFPDFPFTLRQSLFRTWWHQECTYQLILDSRASQLRRQGFWYSWYTNQIDWKGKKNSENYSNKIKKKMTIMTNIGKKFKSTNNNNNNLSTSRTAERYVHGQKIVTFHHWKQNCMKKYFPLNLRIFF